MSDTESAKYIKKEVNNYLTGEAGSRFNYEMFKYGRTQNMIFERRPYQTKGEVEQTGILGLGKQDFTYNVLRENDEEKLITGPLFMGYLVKREEKKSVQSGGEGGETKGEGGETKEEERQTQNQKK